MPKQLNVDLNINANTTQAKKQLQDLQQTLTKLTTSTDLSKQFVGTTEEINKALNSATLLKTQLQSAFNAKTGKLDLTKFVQQMDQSGMSLEKYKNQLAQLGPEGSKAFSQLASQITKAEIPLIRTNKLLTEMGTVLKNTVKWQISSSMIHGFVGGIEQAYSYAQKLNASLTDIQIVTQASSEEMTAFAERANKAAQELNTTTTAYTNAALIFYQQGLSDAEVKERTDSVIKMAQVTGDSAREVSSYMTAIWNNFDDGTQNLEYYADAITALGAATAASSAEIATGMQKFASIADTVGLSYEYATASLATVVAETRLSADVVGTAFKTLFARIQDLDLGQTLEDGTDMGQYSKALAKVGVQIKDANGQLRAMDEILYDLGAAWKDLADDQKVALAQTVAGQRQYAQLMALMENWDEVLENVEIADKSLGTLQKQADIYADSWKGAQKRVRAAMEDLYTTIIDDKFFIKLNNFLADGVKGVNNIIDALGGLPGLLSSIGVVVTNLFHNQIAQGLRDVGSSISMMLPGGMDRIRQQQTKALQLSDDQDRAQLQQQILERAEQMTDFETLLAEEAMKSLEISKQEVDKAREEAELKQKELETLIQINQEREKARGASQASVEMRRKEFDQASLAKEQMYRTVGAVPFSQNVGERIYDMVREADVGGYWSNEYSQRLNVIPALAQKRDNDSPRQLGDLQKIKEAFKELRSEINFTDEAWKKMQIGLDEKASGSRFINALRDAFKESGYDLDAWLEKMNNVVITENKLVRASAGNGASEGAQKAARAQLHQELQIRQDIQDKIEESDATQATYNRKLENTRQVITSLTHTTFNWADAATAVSSSFMSLSMVFNSIKGIISVAKDETMSFGEQITSIMSSFVMMIPTATMGVRNLLSTLNSAADAQMGQISAVLAGNIALTKEQSAALAELILAKKINNKEDLESLSLEELREMAALAGISLTKRLTDEELKEALAKAMGKKASDYKIKGQFLENACMAKGIVTTKALTKEEIVAAIANRKLGDSFKRTAGDILKGLAPYAAAAAALAALAAMIVFLVKAGIDSYNALDEKQQKSVQTQEALKNAYDDANKKFDELKKNIESYESALKGLNELTKGTEEFRDALDEANKSALNLIETANISAENYHWEDGLLTIDSNALQEAQEVAENQVQTLYAANLNGIDIASQSVLHAQRLNTARGWNNQYMDEAGSEYVIGALARVGSYIAAFQGQDDFASYLRNDATSDIVYRNTLDSLDALAASFQEVGYEALYSSDLYTTANDEMKKSIEDYCVNMRDAAEITRLHNQQIAHSYLEGQGYSDEVVNYAAEAYTIAQQVRYNELMSQMRELSQASDGSNTQAIDLFDKYAEASGLQNVRLEDVIGDDEHRAFTYYLDGELKTVTDQQIAATLAASEAISSLGEAADNAAQFLNRITDENQHSVLEQMFANFSNGRVNASQFAGNVLSGTNIDVTDLMNYWTGEGEFDEDQLGTDFQEVLDAYGITYQQVVDFANSTNAALGDIQRDLVEGLLNEQNAFNEYLDNRSTEARNLRDTTSVGQLNNDAARIVLDFFENARRSGVGDTVSDLMSNMSSDEAERFAQTLSQVDWNSINSSQLLQMLNEADVPTKGFEGALVELCNQLRVVTADTVTAAAEYYNALEKIANGLTDQSDTISAEDWAALPENMQRYFALMLDGSYKLLITARDFQEMVALERRNDALDTLNSYYEQLNKISEINYSDYAGLREQSALSYRTQYHQGSVVDSTTLSGYDATDYQGNYIGTFATRAEAEAAALEAYQVLDNIDFDNLQQKIEFITQYTSEFNDELNQIGENITEDEALRIEEIFDGLISSEEELNKRIEQVNDNIRAQENAIALSYNNLDDLREARERGEFGDSSFNMAAYQIDQAQDTAMLDQEEWQNYADYIQEAADSIDEFNDNMSDLEAKIVAKSLMKMNQAIETLNSNFEEWNDIILNSDDSSQEFADAIINMRKAVAELLDISEDFVDSDFINNRENLELIGRAAEGDAEAIEDLREALSREIIGRIILDNDIQNSDEIMNQYNTLVENLPDIKIGTTLESGEFVNALNKLIEDTGMTVDQVNALCDSMGFEAHYVSQEEPMNNTYTEIITHHRRTNVRDTDKDGEDDSWDDIEWSETREVPYNGKFTAFSMTTDGTTPVISAVTKKASGAQNNFSSSNPGGGRPSGGGGGGGKSGSKKDKKDPTGEIERYHVINNQIEDNEKALDRLSKAKDRAYGKAKLNAMDAEIAKQRESVELAERKLQEVEEYLKLDSGAIAAFGAEFDANGTIVNYDQLMQEQIDKYNAAVEAYNNGPMDENADAIFQQAEDDYNAFTEALKQYEETQDLWYEQAQAVADAKAEVLQLELEKTNYKVEIGIEWEEEDIARLDFMLKRIEDDAHKAAEAIGLLGERTVDAMDKYNVYQQGFADTLRNLGVDNAEDVIARASAGEDLYGMIGGIVDPNQMAQAVDQMDDYISNMMSSLKDAQDSVDQAFEKVKDLFNENVKQMDTYIEKIEFCQKITKSYMNIVDIVGKKSLGITNEMLRTFNAESVTQAINNEAAAKAKMDSIQAQLMESQARLAQASGEAEQKYWNEIIEEQEKELISATENFHQAWEDALQANLEAFENNIELVIEDFSNAVGDLNAMKAEWDLQKSLTDMWEPEYERWHQLSDLINDINKSVDENKNLKYKQDLLDLETEIEQLQEQEAELSEYDLNYLRLRYESKLAEIALEEAQAAKSQVRMSRDNEGNYSYVYTADEEAVNNAADDYRNKIYEMEKANEEYIDTLQQQLLEMHDKMLEDIQQAGELYGVGTQAYYDAVARIQETYVGQSEFIQLQMQNVFTNNQRLRDEDIVQYVAYTGDIAAETVDLQTSFGDTYMGIQTQTDDLQTYFNDTWLPALNETFDNVILKAEEYSQQNEAAMETAGTTMDGFRDRASQDILEVTERTTELTEETQRYGETAVDQFAQAARAWQTGPGALLDAINAQATAIANLAQQYTSLKSQMDAAAEAARDFAAAMGQRVSVSPSIPSVPPTSGGSGGGGGGGGSTSPSPNNSQNLSGAYRAQQALVAELVSELRKPMTSAVQARREELRRQLHELEATYGLTPSGYDTGGYTGEWGDDGRLAVLHQKELVLNAKDTSNILTAVDVVRQLASSIDFNTMTASLATANIKSASGNSGTLEQRVEITANFPNATDRNEIEQAFQNIVNMASQYAQRKND